MEKPEKMNLKRYVEDFIIPTLERFDLYSNKATKLIAMSSNTESQNFKYTRQKGFEDCFKEGAFGYVQMELETYYDIWNVVLKPRKKLSEKIIYRFFPEYEGTVEDFFKYEIYKEDAAWKLRTKTHFGIIMMRCQYMRFKEPLPEYEDDKGMAEYWKKYYNRSGKGTPEHCLKLWEVVKNQMPNLK